jgi:hypothetical protein
MDAAMSDPIIKDALQAAARVICICDGECFATRHGMMHGPCERNTGAAGVAIAAFLRALPSPGSKNGAMWWCQIPAEEETRLWLADAVDKAARDD